MWNLPIEIEIEGQVFPIRNNCDYRVVLDTISCLLDDSLNEQEKAQGALFIFFGDNWENILDYEEAIKEMYRIIGYGDSSREDTEKPPIMNWEHDFQQIAPPISRTLGYDVRTTDKYTHWWTFIGAYMEIGECVFANIISIRNKRQKGKKLEKWEQEFYCENRKLIDLPLNLTDEEQDWLNSD